MANKLRSDAAYKRAIENRRHQIYAAVDQFTYEDDLVIELSTTHEIVAEISLKDIISKRTSLRGVNARLKAAIRPKKAAKKKRK